MWGLRASRDRIFFTKENALQENLFDRAKKNIAKALDQNDDGTLDLKDVTLFAGNVGNAAKKVAETVRKNAKESNEQWNAKMVESKREKELRTLKPIFSG